jgi:hypothetical protein
LPVFLHEIEHTLSSTVPSCVLPNSSAYPAIDADSQKELPAFWKANSEVVRLAMACDLTRVVTFMSSPTTSNLYHSAWAPGMDNPNLYHHASSHAYDMPNLQAINLWYTQRIAEWVTNFKNTQEGDGSGASMLDNMLILYGSEFGDGLHSTSNIPFVLFGKAGGALKTGRYVSYLSSPRSSNDMWLTVLKLLGIPLATIGDPAKCGGVLSNIA